MRPEAKNNPTKNIEPKFEATATRAFFAPIEHVSQPLAPSQTGEKEKVGDGIIPSRDGYIIGSSALIPEIEKDVVKENVKGENSMVELALLGLPTLFLTASVKTLLGVFFPILLPFFVGRLVRVMDKVQFGLHPIAQTVSRIAAILIGVNVLTNLNVYGGIIISLGFLPFSIPTILIGGVVVAAAFAVGRYMPSIPLLSAKGRAMHKPSMVKVI